MIESAAFGAACLAGMALGLWEQEQLVGYRKIDRLFAPEMDEAKRATLCARWQKAVRRSMKWIDT